MAGMTDILMIGLVLVGGYYALQYMQQGGFGQTTAPITYTTPTAPAVLPTLETQCTTEGGKWQGNCCSCPNANCTNPCRGDVHTYEEACETEDGLWQPNQRPPCCSCPNKECSYKCGSLELDPSGGIKGTLSKSATAAGLCQSEGPWFASTKSYGNKWTGNCCSCPNRLCRNKCKSAAPRVPLKESTTTPGAKTPAKRTGTPASRSQSTGGGVGGPGVVKKPAAKPGLTAKQKNLPNKLNQCAGLTGQSYLSCVNSYAHAYLAGSYNRRGPSYTGRDDFRHITNVEFPTPIDFQYEASAHPYYLGPRSPERAALLKRFNSNFATMRFSG